LQSRNAGDPSQPGTGGATGHVMSHFVGDRCSNLGDCSNIDRDGSKHEWLSV
jgi:hypothetical protein